MESHFEDAASDAPSGSRQAAEARIALDAMNRDGERLAARVITPWWYHPALGLITAVFAGAHALPDAWPLAAITLGILAIPVLTTSYARVAGVVVTKPAGQRSRRLLALTVVVLVVTMSTSVAFKFLDVSPGWALIPAGVMFVATVVLGRRYDAALRQEIATSGTIPAR
ncbi:hypothetical protein PlfCFBP13513_08770 [Plantibacter flavus]|uniref:hypothetical protein n=1 Tax=Plantibacter flavus TaxID=150123 RepID=UPI0010C22930|nr:hypothetical protein [Plantibacter flavus]TKJ99456.1 hypothetical protein PlfCFBP13513_08770 [Plantibacter flavus]